MSADDDQSTSGSSLVLRSGPAVLRPEHLAPSPLPDRGSELKVDIADIP
jgi:hypothetical protein